MGKYYSKEVFEAVQYLNYNKQEVIEFTNGEAKEQPIYSSLILGKKLIGIGDYVVKENGKYAVYHPHTFESKYHKI